MFKSPGLLTCLFLFSLSCFSQVSYKRATDIIITENGDVLEYALSGGFNAPQFSPIDLDLDGIKDLVVFDRSSYKVLTFRNSGIPNQVSYTFAPEYISRFPAMEQWTLLRDFNADGKEDIFTSYPGGISVYRNISNAQNGLQFELTQKLLLANYGSFTTNIYVSSADLPSILDVDNDGDMDILNFELGPFAGDAIYFYKNLSKETYGTADSLNYKVEKRCWGRFREAPDDCTVILNDTNGACKNGTRNAFAMEELEFLEQERQNRSNAHAGSTVLAFDANGDTRLDLLIGDISCSKMYLVNNDGNNLNAHMFSVSNSFPASKPIDIPVFPAAFYMDVNNDGLNDLIAAPNTSNAADNFHATWLYLNTGTASAPEFTFQTDAFLENEMFDLGEGAYPVIFDHNADGKPDIIIGNLGYYNGTGDYTSSLALLENTGTASVPSFKVASRNYANTESFNLDALSPTVGDMDNDNDLDMIIGDLNGQLHLLTNTAGSGTTANFVLNTAFYKNIDVGQFSDPCLADANKDGRPDLVIGEKNANINYYENTGTAASPEFTLRTDTFGRIKYRETNYISGYSSPVLTDADKDNVLELMVAQEDGKIYYYENVEGNLQGTFTKADSFSFHLGERIHIDIGDLNADGFPDLVVGTSAGGISIFYAEDPNSIAVEKPFFSLYPNPTNGELVIKRRNEGKASLEIRDQMGRMVYLTTLTGAMETLSLSNLKEGLYFLSLRTSGEVQTAKFIKISK